MTQATNLLSVISVLWKWKFPVSIVTLTIFVGSIIVSLTLPNYYKSSTTFYAASQDLAKPAPVGTIDRDVEYYGSAEDLDRLFSIANAEEIQNLMIERFSLYEHYGINPESPRSKDRIKKKFNKLYKTIKTQYDALELSIEDRDPEFAALMANEARIFIDSIAQSLIKNSQFRLIKAQNGNIANKEKQLAELNDSLTKMKSFYGIYDLTSQAEVLVSQKTRSAAKLTETKAKIENLENTPSFQDSILYFKALVNGYTSQLNQINKEIKSFNDGYSKVMSLDRESRELSSQLGLDKERMKQLTAVYQSDFPSLHVVDVAIAPTVKSRPKRSIYVIIATVLGLILTVLSVLLLESYRSVNWKEVLHGSDT